MHEATVNLMHGNVCNGAIEKLPAASVQCCVTSPPYWGLRDYGVEGQLGLERSFKHYVDRIVDVFQAVRRALRHDGTLWLNIGDTYTTRPYGDAHTFDPKYGGRNRAAGYPNRSYDGTGLKHKDLCGIPWRVALALQDDGWYLRRDIIWHKTNPMPESATDRPGTAHEYLFLLSKSQDYFYDRFAIMEPVSGTAHSRGSGVNPKARVPSGWDTRTGTSHHEKTGRYKTAGTNSRIHVDRDPRHSPLRKSRQNESYSSAISATVPLRNKRSVWSIPTQAYRGAHFATFPERLVEPCILAGTSAAGCCVGCGAPVRRVLDSFRTIDGERVEIRARVPRMHNSDKSRPSSAQGVSHDRTGSVTEHLGWEPSCTCTIFGFETLPCTVLDPFCGSGTTGAVALRHGRSFVGIDISREYLEMADRRIGKETAKRATA